MAKVTFRFTGKELPGYIRLRAQGKTLCLHKDTTVDFESCQSLTAELEWIDFNQYLAWKIKNPVLRALCFIPLYLVEFILLALYFFLNVYDSGLSMENAFGDLNPFQIRKTITISDPDGKTVSIGYRDAKYQKIFKKYTPPELSIDEEFVTCIASEVLYSEKLLKKEWLFHAVPGFCLLWAMSGLTNFVAILVLAKVIRELPVNSLGWNVFAIGGTGVCFLVVFGLLIALILSFCKLYKMCGKITQYQNDESWGL